MEKEIYFDSEELNEYIENSYFENYKNKFEEAKLSVSLFNVLKRECIDELNEKYGENLINITENDLNQLKSNISKTKERWGKKELKTEEGLEEEMELARMLYKDSLTSKRFTEIYKVNSLKELHLKRKEEMEEWIRIEKLPIISFKYLGKKTGFQVERAVKNDIRLLIMEYHLDKYEKADECYIIEMPNTISNVPFEANERGQKLDMENVKESNIQGVNKRYYGHLYKASEDKSFESILEVEALMDNAISQILDMKNIKVLNADDFSVFSYIISKRELNFYARGQITLPIEDIAEGVFGKKTTYNYRRCKASLFKLGNIRISVINEELRGFTIGILERVVIGKHAKGDIDVANITINEDIIEDFIKKRTTLLYKDSLNNLKNQSSQVLVFDLQAERISHFAENSPSQKLELHMSYFRAKLLLANKREDRNINKIVEALEEMKNNNLIIKEYERARDFFYITFLPFTKKEKRDLIDRKEEIIIKELTEA